jgi:Spy/CpxP family protein refolding chaperone
MKTMKQTRLGIILSLLLAFAAGAAAGIFADRFLLNSRGHHRPGPSPEKWEKDLGLTEDQKARIHEIFKKNDDRVDELRSDFFKHVGEIRFEIRKEIDAVLTPEQKVKQDALMEKFRKTRSRDDGSRPADSTPRPEGGHSKENSDEKENSDGSGDPGRDRGGDPDHFLY